MLLVARCCDSRLRLILPLFLRRHIGDNWDNPTCSIRQRPNGGAEWMGFCLRNSKPLLNCSTFIENWDGAPSNPIWNRNDRFPTATWRVSLWYFSFYRKVFQMLSHSMGRCFPLPLALFTWVSFCWMSPRITFTGTNWIKLWDESVRATSPEMGDL